MGEFLKYCLYSFTIMPLYTVCSSFNKCLQKWDKHWLDSTCGAKSLPARALFQCSNISVHLWAKWLIMGQLMGPNSPDQCFECGPKGGPCLIGSWGYLWGHISLVKIAIYCVFRYVFECLSFSLICRPKWVIMGQVLGSNAPEQCPKCSPKCSPMSCGELGSPLGLHFRW